MLASLVADWLRPASETKIRFFGGYEFGREQEFIGVLLICHRGYSTLDL
jgi:hypothetical protein